MKYLLLTITLMLSASTYAQSEGDIYLATNGSTDSYFRYSTNPYDGKNIDVYLKQVTKTTFKKGNNGKKTAIPGNKLVAYVTIHCESSTYDQTDYILYDSKGHSIESGNFSEYDKRIFPETIIELLKEKVCPNN